MLASGLTGCTSAAQRQARSGAPTAAPADFAMSFGKGGGFAGRWQGYTIAADGAVAQWEGRITPDNLSPVGSLSPAQVDSLWQRVNALDFFSLESQGTGNMTGYIEVAAEGRTHEVRWPVSLEKEAAQAPWEQLYAYARALVEAARQE